MKFGGMLPPCSGPVLPHVTDGADRTARVLTPRCVSNCRTWTGLWMGHARHPTNKPIRESAPYSRVSCSPCPGHCLVSWPRADEYRTLTNLQLTPKSGPSARALPEQPKETAGHRKTALAGRHRCGSHESAPHHRTSWTAPPHL